MGFDFKNNGKEDKEDLLIFEEIQSDNRRGNAVVPALVVMAIVVAIV